MSCSESLGVSNCTHAGYLDSLRKKFKCTGDCSNPSNTIFVNQPFFSSDTAVMHECMPVSSVFPVEEVAVDYCINVSGGYVSPMHRLIIHCIKTRPGEIRHTGCIQGNRIELALLYLIPSRLDNMNFGLLH